MSDVKWSVAQRFEFIEWRVYWNGRLNRGDLEQEFAISTPQASVDLRNYQAVAPGNIEYDPILRTYARGPNFRPQFLRLSSRKYLEQVRGMVLRYVDIHDTWFDDMPNSDAIPNLNREPNEYILEPIVNGIKYGKSIAINYLSFTKSSVRNIRPTALCFDGVRWHARAWCFKNETYRDFVLGRILSVGPSDAVADSLKPDAVWETYIKLRIVPSPGLSDYQRQAIERDYMMDDGERIVNLRAALAFYFVRRHNFDISESISPQRRQISLANYNEYVDIMNKLGVEP